MTTEDAFDPAAVLRDSDTGTNPLRMTADEFLKIIPYKGTRDQHGATYQLRSHIHPDVGRAINEIVSQAKHNGIPWLAVSDFVRDAVFKYASVIYEHFNRFGEFGNFLRAEQNMARMNGNIERRREMFKNTQGIVGLVGSLIEDGSEAALAELVKELRSWVAAINFMADTDPYWASRYARLLVESDHVKRVLRWLQGGPHKDEQWVNLLGRWLDQYGRPAARVQL